MPSRDVTQRVRERIRSASQLRFGERGAQFAVLAGILLVVLGVGVFIGVLDAVWALVGKAQWQASLLAGAMVVSTAVSLTVKAVVARPRPPHPHQVAEHQQE